MDKFVKTYKELAKVPDFKNGTIAKIQKGNNPSISIQVNWGIRNLPSKQRFSRCISYLVQGDSVHQFPSCLKDKTVILSKFDESGTKSAEILQDDDMRQLVIYNDCGPVHCLNLKELDLHGIVYSDMVLSSLSWSRDSSHIAFVAEKKRPKPSSFLSENKKSEADGIGREYAYYDDFGEQMEGAHQSTLVVVDVKSTEVKVLDFPGGISGGGVKWMPNGEALVGIAYVTEPFRLGLVYCKNRQNFIFRMDLDGKFSELTGRDQSIGSFTLSPDGSKIVFLSSEIGGPHIRSAKLCAMQCDSKKVSVLVDEVQRDRKLENGHLFRGFNGASNFPSRCWSEDGSNLFISTINHNRNVVYIVNAESGAIEEIPYPKSLLIQDVKNDWLLLSTSSLTSSSQVLLSQFAPSPPGERQWKFLPLSSPTVVEGVPEQEEWTFVNPVPHPVAKYSDLPIPVIYVGPTRLEEGESKRPLIVWPHGGPHSAIPGEYSLMVAFFLRIGYSIVFPNFRGSLGQGKEGIDSLPGHCGTVDLQDVQQCTILTLKRYENVLDETRVFLNGGSHGGFLVTSLAAAFPDTYKAVCARNPATDIFTMSRLTDIIDWCFVEAGLPFEQSKLASTEEMAKMQNLSPLANIDRVKAPISFYLGTKDKRVPYSQGLFYHKMLLARGIPTKAFIYEDNHSLLKLAVEADHIIQMALWYQEHGNGS